MANDHPLRRPLFLALAVLAPLSPLAGCGPTAPGAPGGCSSLAYYSVNVDVVDPMGAAIADLAITYSVDGGDTMTCDEFSETEYGCGVEQPGDFTITVDAPGFVSATEDATVESDECHVIPATLFFVLEPAP